MRCASASLSVRRPLYLIVLGKEEEGNPAIWKMVDNVCCPFAPIAAGFEEAIKTDTTDDDDALTHSEGGCPKTSNDELNLCFG
jgi:hypothetical protein